jgi:alcohol dehydrogenase class IV
MENGADKALRSNMALASYYAGIAFSNASTNLAHAGGRALGAQFHVPHGLSVALLLPFVMEFGLEVAEERYARVAVALGAEPQALRQTLARQAVAIVDGYNDKFGIWTEAKRFITDLAAFRKAIPEMTAKALAGNGILTNPKVPTESDINAVFEKLAAKLAD